MRFEPAGCRQLVVLSVAEQVPNAAGSGSGLTYANARCLLAASPV
jgi:hypothetical protein